MFPSIGALRARCADRQRISRGARAALLRHAARLSAIKRNRAGAAFRPPLPASAGVLSIGKRLLDQLDDLRLMEQLGPHGRHFGVGPIGEKRVVRPCGLQCIIGTQIHGRALNTSVLHILASLISVRFPRRAHAIAKNNHTLPSGRYRRAVGHFDFRYISATLQV